MKIAVIGGSGFIGTRLVKELKEAGHIVRIFDKAQSRTFPDKVIVGDVRDATALTKALAGIDIIYNLAAEHRDDVTPTTLYYDVNVEGARNIVWAAKANGIRKIIFTSTVAVYGLNKTNPDEKSPTEPFNHYSKSKLQAEKIFSEWAGTQDDHCLVTLRPVVIFGEGNRGNVYNLIKQIQSNKFMMVGGGNNRKSMAYIGNVTKFLANAASFEPGNHIFNIATKPDMNVGELVKLIRAELDISTSMTRLPYWIGLVGGFAFDLLAKMTGKRFPISTIRIQKFCATTTISTKSLEATGFQQPYTLHEGIKSMIANLDQNIYFEGGG
ncbi:MAG: NAD-dependent epimerase/dehydratase family protein [Spirochaetales bacterium]|jgi:nucleoside-diphosphate-sugar epimerase|nr:NAD-dependent epimerase/dehydratase family protein [Spirochaetales bacterium]